MEERTRRPEVRALPADDDEANDWPERAPLTPEEAQALREQHPPLAPWRVVAVQGVVGLVVAALAAVLTGRGVVGWSALYGAAAVVVPGGLMVRGLARTAHSRQLGTVVFGFLLWEFIKVGVATAMLVAAALVVRDLNWPAMLVTMVLCMKVNWLALLWQGRVRATKKRS